MIKKKKGLLISAIVTDLTSEYVSRVEAERARSITRVQDLVEKQKYKRILSVLF